MLPLKKPLAALLSLICLSAPMFASATTESDDIAPTTEKTTSEIELVGTRGLNLANFDQSVRACDNFYQHANGGWLSRNPIPADQAQWGSFGILGEQSLADVRELAEAAASAKAETGSAQQQVGDLYTSFLDQDTVDSLGLRPIAGDLADIAAIKNKADVVAYLIARHATGDDVLLRFGIGPDLKNSQINFAYASQAGLGLPNKSYYEPTDEVSKALLEKYQAHMTRMFELSGDKASRAEARTERVFALEQRLAKASLSPVELRDPGKRYNPVSVAEANALTPNFDWSALFAALDVAPEKLSVAPTSFFSEVDAMLADVSVEAWRDYFTWNLLRDAAPYLHQPLVDENFDFYSRELAGAKVQTPRNRRAVGVVNGLLGEPMGQLYVAAHFPPEAKAQMAILIDDLRASLKNRLENLEWMGPETRAKALEKLATFSPKIGYPEKWKDYSDVEIKRDDLIGNIKRVATHVQRDELAKLGQPVDRTEWRMSPQTVNAYYNPTMNEIVFPAAILQPPFFDPEADPAVNYGAIGAVIGHELLHGFDDSGSRFDALGNLNNWWTKEDRDNFESRTAKLVAQYNGYKVAGLNVNGQLSLGENIADLGGVTVAYDALQARLEREPTAPIDDMTQEQRFFAAWSQVWRINVRPERMRLQVQSNTHAPGQFRGMGPMVNFAPFAQAFGCKEGDPMVAPDDQRVVIW